jgi:hypothetical protein
MAPIIVAMARPLAGAEGLEDKDCELMSKVGRLVEACARGALARILPHPNTATLAACGTTDPIATVGDACADVPLFFALPGENCRAVATRLARHRLERLRGLPWQV